MTLSPADINGGDTNRTFFDDGDLRLSPFIGDNAATFNSNGSRLGIDDQGTNVGAFNDPDTDPDNGNEEILRFEFSATSGLTQIGWDFSRAERIEITGFLADPMASFSGRNFAPSGLVPDLSAMYDASTGTLSFGLPFDIGFADDDGFLDLGNAFASAGATLELRVTDTQEAGAQLAITTISYNNQVPAPGAFGLSVLAAGFAARRRSR